MKKKPRIISDFNQKGGVGKTTTTINLSAALSLLDKKVLVIDFDPQANVTDVLLRDQPVKVEESIYQIIQNDIRDIEINPVEFIKTYEKGKVKIDILPSHLDLAIMELDLVARAGREFFLKRIIESIIEKTDYDFIIIDSQPSLGVLVMNVLCCSLDNELIIHLRADRFSRKSVEAVFKTIKHLKKNLALMPKNYNILITQYSDQQISDRDNVNQVEKDLPTAIFNTIIRKNVDLSRASDDVHGCDIFNLNPESFGALDYMKLAKEIISNEE